MKRWPSILIPALIGLTFFNTLLLSGCGRDVVVRGNSQAPLSSDVIIIGDTIAALVAALEAASQGAAVLVFFSKMNEDRWLWNEGAIAADFETAEGSDSSAALRELLSAYGEGRGQSWFYDLMARQAGPDLDWFARETGLEWSQENTLRQRPDNLTLAQVYERLLYAAGLEGVRFFPGTVVQEMLFKDRGSKVIGIKYSGAPGLAREAYAPVVVLADGSYLENEALMQTLAPAVSAAHWRRGQSGLGWQLCLDAGLDMVEPNLFAYAPAVEDGDLWVEADWPEKALLVIDDRIVPLDGKSKGDVVAELLGSKSATGYLLISENQLAPEQELNWPRFSGIEAFLETYRLDLPQLKHWFMQPWGFFRAQRVKAVAEYCLGGAAVNEQGKLMRGGNPVDGLYGAGEITGGLHGWGLAPGAALTEAVVWGRYIGRKATEQFHE
ncbi:MAG: FAD-binding protein [Bacillota bacterium]